MEFPLLPASLRPRRILGGTASTAWALCLFFFAPVTLLGAVDFSNANLAATATTLTINGSGFNATTPGNNLVTFNNGATGLVTAATSTSLTVTGISGLVAGSLTAQVSVDGGSNTAPVQVAVVTPVVTSSTTSLPANTTTLTINGFGFSLTPANNTVLFNNGAGGTVTSATNTQLTVTSLTGQVAGSLTAVVTSNGQNSGAAVQVATVTPVVTLNTGNLASNSSSVTINGLGFDATASNNSVVFNNGAVGTVAPGLSSVQILTFGAGSSTGQQFRLRQKGIQTGQINYDTFPGNLISNVQSGLDSSFGAGYATVGLVSSSGGTIKLSVTINLSSPGASQALFTCPTSSLGGGAPTIVGGTRMMVNFTANPTIGNLTAIVTSNSQSSGAAVQVASVMTGDLVISEFRLRGPGGVNDEYVEIYNRTAADITVQAVDASAGFALVAGDGTTRFVIPNGTVIPAHGHYLGANNGTSGYSLTSLAVPDITWTTDIPSSGASAGVALFKSSTTLDMTTRLDAVGYSTAGVLYREGAGLSAGGAEQVVNIQYAYYRSYTASSGIALSDGEPRDTDVNTADFAPVDTNGTLTGNGQRVGMPNPRNLASPISAYHTSPNIGQALLDTGVAHGAAPNLVRSPSSYVWIVPGGGTVNWPEGVLDFSRTFKNNTGAALTRLRFRVISLTTFPENSGTADLRPIDAPGGTLSTSGGNVSVMSTSLDEPQQNFNGGGLNNTLSVPSVTAGTPLAAGASINLRFRFGVAQTGAYRMALLVEGLPSTSHLWFVTGNIDGTAVVTGSTDTYSSPFSAPVVTTPTSAGITSSVATLGGDVTSDSGSTITERGVVYSITSTNNDPLIGGTGVTKVTASGTTGVFTANATGLSANTGYSFKAYATNSMGTTYTTPVSTFTTLAVPVVTSVSPTAGPTTGGTTVTITGTNLAGATAVTFGATAATGFTVNSNTQITATAPAGTGTVNVRVTTAGGTSATSAADLFGYMPAPTVTSVSPPVGPQTGGATVTITGTNFLGVTGVAFGATSATGFTILSSTQIMATAPAGTGTVDVRVTTIGGTSATSAADQFTYVAAPTVTSISPTAGPTAGGTTVTITGTNFTGTTAVTFGATAATGFTVNSNTQITATAPAGTGTVDIRVTMVGGTSATSAADQFTYIPAPTVTSVSPTAGPATGGTTVTITGTNLAGATAVTFGATAATGFTINSNTQITATAPAGTGTVNVRVTTAGGTSATSAADLFGYMPAPTVTSVSPPVGPQTGGATVTITGTNFLGVTAVTFGVTAATTFTVNSSTSITATAPAGTGTVDVRVTTIGGTSATSAADQFTYVAAPTVTSISPTAGPTAGGTTVTITGTNFTGTTAVTFGATAATGFTVNSNTQITATAPAGTGTVDIRVTMVGGTSATSAADQFTYVPAPTVISVSPTFGPEAGGTTVTITGTNFAGATAVTFGATSATGFTINSATSITATSPAGTGTMDITVTTAGGTSATSVVDQFTYIPAPTVTSVSPTAGPTTGGTTVTITGTNFAGATAVTFGATPATGFTINSATSITATSPAAGIGTVDIRVTTAGGTSATSAADKFTYTAATTATITSSSSGSSPSGTAIVGSDVTLTITVSAISGGFPPIGLLQIRDNTTNTVLGTAIPDSPGTSGINTRNYIFTIAAVQISAPGIHDLTAGYVSGSGYFTNHTSANFPLLVGTVNPTPVAPATVTTRNLQNGLSELVVTVQNTTASVINGFRLNVDFSAYLGGFPTLKLYNATSPSNVSPPYVDYPFPMIIGQSVSLTLQFYTNNRVMPNSFVPVLTVQSLAASQVPHANDIGVLVTNIINRVDGSKLLEFNTVAGSWYRVSYSPNMSQWYYSPVPIKAGSNKTQWIDNGAPGTASHPNTVPSRFYKVSQIPAP